MVCGVVHGHGRRRRGGRRGEREKGGWGRVHEGVAHLSAELFKELVSLGNGDITRMGILEIANVLEARIGCLQEDLEGGEWPSCLEDISDVLCHVPILLSTDKGWQVVRKGFSVHRE